MTNSCSLSRIRALSVAGVAAGAVAAASVWVPIAGFDIVATVAGAMAAVAAGVAFALAGRVSAWVRRTREVSAAIAAGDFEQRLVRLDEGGELGGCSTPSTG